MKIWILSFAAFFTLCLLSDTNLGRVDTKDAKLGWDQERPETIAYTEVFLSLITPTNKINITITTTNQECSLYDALKGQPNGEYKVTARAAGKTNYYGEEMFSSISDTASFFYYVNRPAQPTGFKFSFPPLPIQ